MALFTDKRELSRQAEKVPFKGVEGKIRRLGTAIMGYDPDTGEKNMGGKVLGKLPLVGLDTLTNLGARAFANDSSDANEVIKKGTKDEVATDVNKLNFAWQAFKIYLAAGGSVGGGGGGGGGTVDPSVATTGGEVAAGSGTAVPGIDPTQGYTATQATLDATTGSTTLATDMAQVGTSMTAPELNIADYNIVGEGSSLPNLPENIEDADPTMKEKFLTYLNTNFDGVDGREDGTGLDVNKEDVVSRQGIDVFGREGSGTGEGIGSDPTSEYEDKGPFTGMTAEEKKKLNDNLKKGVNVAQSKKGRFEEGDFNTWKEEAEKRGLQVVGKDAVDGQGNIVSSFDNEQAEKDEAAAATKRGFKEMLTGNIVGAGIGYVGSNVAATRGYEDRYDELNSQKSISTSYLL
tara:strand:- start:2847 stop:4058 length:1212 start_codon:yes stop_codon:yes gene_type:complete